MYFQQFYLACLAQASYMLGSEGIAAVVDPQRDVDIYLEEARKQGLRIQYIIETHMHADFVSGHVELASKTGAQAYVCHAAGAGFPHVAVHDGDELKFGRCVLRFLETPGHSEDSMCIVVTDLERGEDPWAVLTGDTLFIGEVGRPDLSRRTTPHELAGQLFDSLHEKLLKLPDDVEVYPAHGAGSLCGRAISNEQHSTIGRERMFNYALRPMPRETFIELMTSDMPERPEYFHRDREINRAGAPALDALPPLPALSPGEVANKQQSGAVVLDTRPAAKFGAGHVPGSLHIGLAGQFASWAGTLIGIGPEIVLVSEDEQGALEARIRLARVGIDNVCGYLDSGILAWQQAGWPVGEVPQIAVVDLHRDLTDHPGEVQVVDVRRPGEWDVGRLANAVLKPLDKLRESLGDLDRERPVAVHCKSGYRSSMAASILKAGGFREVMNVVGGFDAWQAHDLPVVRSQVDTAPAQTHA